LGSVAAGTPCVPVPRNPQYPDYHHNPRYPHYPLNPHYFHYACKPQYPGVPCWWVKCLHKGVGSGVRRRGMAVSFARGTLPCPGGPSRPCV